MPSPEAGATTPAASPASTTSRPLSQRVSGLQRDRRAFAADRLGAVEAGASRAARRPRCAARSPCGRCRCRCWRCRRAGRPSRRSRARARRGNRRRSACRRSRPGRCAASGRSRDRRRRRACARRPGIAWRATAESAPSAPITARARTVSIASLRLGPVANDSAVPSASRVERARRCRCGARRRRRAARSRSHSSNTSRSTMPTKPSSIGMSTWRSDGETMRAEVTRATSRSSGMSKSRIRRGGIAPPQGLMRPARSSSSTERPAPRQVAAPRSRRPGRRRPRRRRRSRCGHACVMRCRCRTAIAGAAASSSRRRRAGRSRSGQHGRDQEQHAPRPRTRARRRAPASREPGARGRWRPCRRSRRGRRRSPAPRPTGPCACLRATRAPVPASAIIEPIAATAKTPLATPSANTDRAQRPGRADEAGAARGRASASAEARQPPTVQSRQRAEPPAADSAAGERHQHHADQHAAMLHAGQLASTRPA